MELIQLLINQLGINEQQAKGGLGALLAIAKTKLSDGSLAELTKLLPGMTELIKQAPQSGGGFGALGGLLGGNLGDMAKLAGQFSSLGMSQSQLVPFAKLAFDFLQQHLPPEAKEELLKLAKQFIK